MLYRWTAFWVALYDVVSPNCILGGTVRCITELHFGWHCTMYHWPAFWVALYDVVSLNCILVGTVRCCIAELHFGWHCTMLCRWTAFWLALYDVVPLNCILVGTVRCCVAELHFLEPLFSCGRGSVLNICILAQCNPRSSCFFVRCIITCSTHTMNLDWLSVWGYTFVTMVIRLMTLHSVSPASSSSLLSSDNFFPLKYIDCLHYYYYCYYYNK